MRAGISDEEEIYGGTEATILRDLDGKTLDGSEALTLPEARKMLDQLSKDGKPARIVRNFDGSVVGD